MYETVFTPISVICPWIKGSFSVSENNLVVRLTNTVFAVVPAGRSEHCLPLQNVSACILERYYDMKAMIGGILLIIISMLSFFGGTALDLFAGILLFLAGIVFVMSSIKTIIRIQNSGAELSVFVPFYAADKAKEAKAMIDKAIGL